MKLVIGIDNGVSGSIGVYSDGFYDFVQVPVFKEQDYQKKPRRITRVCVPKLADLLKKYKGVGESKGLPTIVVLERPLVNPKRFFATLSGVRAFEATLIAIDQAGLPYYVVDSRKWQKVLSKHPEGLKVASLEQGIKEFPDCEKKIRNHGDCDGLWIAKWFYMKMKGGF